MAKLIPYMPQFFESAADGSGAAFLVGGKLYSYEAGTTIPTPTYTNADDGVPNANPVILDARGEAQVWIDPNVAYKFVLTDANDVQIWSIDNTGGEGVDTDTRERLTASRTYYVRTDGSDSNDGLSNTSGGAFLTLQKAADVVLNDLDLSGFDVTVSVADGAYTAGVSIAAPWIGEGSVYFIGDTTTPSNCTVTVASGNCFALENGARLSVRGFKLSTTGSGNCLQAYLASSMSCQDIEFGACAVSHLECGTGSTILVTGNYSITGSAVSHWHCGSPGIISIGAYTVTLTGTPAFSSYFAGAAQAGNIVSSATFVGSATGTRFVVHKNAFIEAVGGSITTFPGNADGVTNIGGIFAGAAAPWYLQPFNGAPTVLALRSRNFNAQTFDERFKVTSEALGGFGYAYVNGSDSYMSGRTHFAGDATVDVTTGTADGWTFTSKALVASNFYAFMASANSATVGYLRRRTSNGDVLGFFRDTTNVGSISVTTTNTGYNTSSDYRLKAEVQDLTGSGSFIDALRPRSWVWTADGSAGSGFVAHELQDVSPSSVTGEKDAVDADGKPVYQTVGYGSAEIIANLVAEVQDLRRRLARLEDKQE